MNPLSMGFSRQEFPGKVKPLTEVGSHSLLQGYSFNINYMFHIIKFSEMFINDKNGNAYSLFKIYQFQSVYCASI